MLDAITRCTITDFDAVWQLYVDVCEHQAYDPYGPKWTLGVYPTADDVRNHIEAGELYVGWLDDTPVAGMALVAHEDEEYAEVPWITPADDDEIAVIHLLCVHPRARGHQTGAQMVREAIRLSREMGMRVIHLDVVPGNLAASRIYLQEGFVLVGTQQIYYEDTGLADFDMYECVL
jgi:ribosomal protein S18 acetylase RimI-like enzyme